jgi:2-polyprenyl-3-methyl-5-hydroxy-6-metoxy-1,4-benzoquinol methylase
VDVYADAPQSSSAAKFGTVGITFRAWKAKDEGEWTEALTALSCTTRSKRPPMNPNKALWEKGDFTEIAATMRRSGEALVDSLGITKGMRVLDVGCGDGTTALPLARLGAEVTGVDIASNLVAAGNERAAQAGLRNLKFQEGTPAPWMGSATIPSI